MPDEPSLGEVARTLERLERQWSAELARVRTEHTADIQRVEREHAEDLRALREDVIKPLQERLRMTFGRWVGVLGVVAAFATVMITAYATAKGAK